MNTSNLDPAERDRFNELASSWWDPQGESKPLHDLNPARLRYIRDRATLAGAAVVDVGCGGGLLSEGMAAMGARVTGLDVARRALDVARLHLHESQLEVDYVETTVEAYADDHAGTFDVVTCLEMIEHVPDPVSVVAACARLLKPGGQAFFSTLNRTPVAFALAIVGAEHVMRMLPRGTHRYDRFIRPSELSAWLRRAGLEVHEVTGLHYNPLSGTVRTGGRLDVNYLVHASRPVAAP
ncbi:bifunctional 2-polyprenyl-6-hydroxyphenol methylase/3-demethylubiquinol 3-O-methyltransferase UbiG [Marinihelvus fidelis]|uniref:Ubiquinone biosynthesis O-methyltransferase n=1 Tax=Marinihelvus fidelis TaxID=2613842 RepID=A0A5N0TA36_9GAMM|nr:bifunctional 2-polyprenyl-6-hydroxyphenol methylase/3-demethylubiquinol 3-O-methyltransferase UbiG [Marinihelvus fidelis]KAA9131875.1 bifunctional 2-polyprenyl-6-hydroxyphenol methylase/3-demethylubiquinol 3-O-methyltransferase UbiG [Marinihelvus fidelis]